MTRFRLALAAALVSGALGCHRTTLGPPSPDFQAANAKYLDILANDGPVEVFNDPGIPDIQALLAKVPADSVDSEAAKALQNTITKGVADAQKAAEERKKALAASARPVDVPLPSAGETAPAAPVAAAPAAPAAADLPVAGMSLADFQAKFGACFSRDSAFTDQKGNQGDVYMLATPCQARYPSLANQMVLVSGDKVLSVLPKSAIVGQQQLSIGKAETKPAQQVAQAQATAAPTQAVPPPENPNTIDQKVAAPADNVQVPSNLNSDLDAREKLPGQP